MINHEYVRGYNNEKNLIKNIVNLNEKSVEDLMIPRSEIVALDHDKSYNEILEVIKEEGHSRIPVFKKNIDNVIGFFHIKDFIKSSQDTFQMSEIIRDVLYVAPKSPILDLFITALFLTTKFGTTMESSGIHSTSSSSHLSSLPRTMSARSWSGAVNTAPRARR